MQTSLGGAAPLVCPIFTTFLLTPPACASAPRPPAPPALSKPPPKAALAPTPFPAVAPA